MGASLGGVAALLFLPAGRLDWVAAWLYLGIVTANGAVNYAYLSRRNPELIRHRMRFGKGTKTWDKLWAGAFTPVFMSVYVVAGLDAVRFGWSAMPLWLWPLGLVLFLPGTTLFTWAMGVNPFFEKTALAILAFWAGSSRLRCCSAPGGPSSPPRFRSSVSWCARHWKTAR
jgi:uncharacterized integral membrane protein